MLAKILFWLCVALAVGLGLCVIYAKRQKSNANKYKALYENNNKTINELRRSLDGSRKEADVKSENRKEAKEKINELHHGDALDNALNGLHKHD